ncbi:DUF6234 family protein [Longispora sp. NPDC051575]|uniref:DUF6234 family protein n=1 Tax=Longispora sp. NPDC051575 TaxID=3154943 RepID=UPI0034158E94
MSEREPAAPWSAGAVFVLTLLWLGGLVVLAGFAFSAGMEQWSNFYSETTAAEADSLERQGNLIMMSGGILLFAGPTVIAATAALGRRYWAAGIYGVLAVLTLIAGLTIAGPAYRKLNPPAPEPSPSYVCQETSGEGGPSCPGG